MRNETPFDERELRLELLQRYREHVAVEDNPYMRGYADAMLAAYVEVTGYLTGAQPTWMKWRQK
jgi:hypothetical protein